MKKYLVLGLLLGSTLAQAGCRTAYRDNMIAQAYNDLLTNLDQQYQLLNCNDKATHMQYAMDLKNRFANNPCDIASFKEYALENIATIYFVYKHLPRYLQNAYDDMILDMIGDSIDQSMGL